MMDPRACRSTENLSCQRRSSTSIPVHVDNCRSSGSRKNRLCLIHLGSVLQLARMSPHCSVLRESVGGRKRRSAKHVCVHST
jgi:hypothetical protein